MHRVVAPEPAHAVRGAVVPVVAELLADEEQQHRDPAVERDRRQAVLIGPANERRGDRQRQPDAHRNACDEVEQRHAECAPVVAPPTRQCDRLDQ